MNQQLRHANISWFQLSGSENTPCEVQDVIQLV